MKIDWERAIKSVRLSKRGGLYYSIALSFLIIKNEDHPGMPGTPTLAYERELRNYALYLPPEVEFVNDESHAEVMLEHEFEHLLRLHIPRQIPLIRSSKAAKYYGELVAHAVMNVVQDIIINHSLDAPKGLGVKELDDLPKVLGDWAGLSAEEEKKINLDTIGMEQFFVIVDRKIPIPPDGKTRQERIDAFIQFIKDGIASGKIRLDIDDSQYGDEAKSEESERVLSDGGYEIVFDKATKHLLQSIKSAGSGSKYLKDVAEVDKERYSLESFIDRIVSFTVTDEVTFTRKRPPRKPNCQVGIRREQMAPEVAIMADASGSVDHATYKEFFKVAKSVAEMRGARISFIIFDGDVVYVSDQVPDTVKKTDGGTHFNPPIEKAIELEFSKAIMLTDGMNFDTISLENMESVETLFLLDKEDGIKHIRAECEVSIHNCYYLDSSGLNVIPCRP